VSLGTWKVLWSTPWYATSMRVGVGVEHPDQLVPGRLRRHDAAGGPVQRGLDRRSEERTLDRRVHVRLGEEGRVVDGDDDRLSRPQRHRVVRRVQHVGVDLLDDQRQPGLLPGQPGRPVRDRRRSGHDRGVRCHPGEPFGIGSLAGNGEIGLRDAQRRDQSVDVPSHSTAVGGDGRRIDEHAGRAS